MLIPPEVGMERLVRPALHSHCDSCVPITLTWRGNTRDHRGRREERERRGREWECGSESEEGVCEGEWVGRDKERERGRAGGRAWM